MSPGGLIADWTREMKIAPDEGNTLEPATRSVSEAGLGVDLDNTEVNCAILHVGAVSGTSPSLLVTIEEADTATSNFVPVRRPDPAGTPVAFPMITDGSHCLVLSFRRTKRFCRATAVITGSFTFGVVLSGQRRSF